MEWSNELVLQLIDEYEKHPILWDAKHQFHFNRNKKVDAWDMIGNNLEIEVYEVKRKMNSLLGSFRREKAKGKKSIGTGKGRCEIYITKWFAFDRMHFLLDKDEPRTTIHTDNIKQEEEEACNLEEVDNNSQITQDEEIVSLKIESQTLTQPVHSATPPKQNKRLNTSDDPRLEEAYKILKESVKSQPPSDNFSVYGQHIANKLRSYSKTTQTEVEHAFNNILYNADRGVYDHPGSNP